jgi:hypothetical protein
MSFETLYSIHVGLVFLEQKFAAVTHLTEVNHCEIHSEGFHIPVRSKTFLRAIFLHALLYSISKMPKLGYTTSRRGGGLSCTPVSLAILPSPRLLFFTLNLPCRLAAEADALLGMVDSDLLLLLLLLLLQSPPLRIRISECHGPQSKYKIVQLLSWVYPEH